MVSSLAHSLKNKRLIAGGGGGELEESASKRQIIICTRTHSQMIQIVNELKKCRKFAGRVSIVSLTSRKGLCVHPKVKNFQSANILTEKCEDLTEKTKCPYNDGDLTQILTQNILAEPTDIEELGSQAAKMQICGYYASRRAQTDADIIVTPYQTMLSEATRSSVGISLYSKERSSGQPRLALPCSACFHCVFYCSR